MITPVDIQSKTFKSGIGYDKRDVDGFMSDVLANYEELYRSNVEMKDKITVLNDSLQHYKTLEASLQKALMLAEKTSEETLKIAEDKAKSIELEAINKAKEYTANSKIELERVHAQTVTLVQQYTKFKAQFNQLIKTHMDVLNSTNFDMSSSDFDAFATSQASMNDALNSSNPFGGFGGNDFNSFDDPQGRESSSLGGLGSGFGSDGSGFSGDPFNDPRATSAGSELTGVSLLNNDPFAPKMSFEKATAKQQEVIKPQPVPVQPTPVVEPQPVPVQPTPVVEPQPVPVQPMPVVEPQPVTVQPTPVVEPIISATETTYTAYAEAVAYEEEYGEDVFVGEIEDVIDRRNLIGDGDDPDDGFEFI